MLISGLGVVRVGLLDESILSPPTVGRRLQAIGDVLLGCYIVVDDQGGKHEVKQEDARPVDPNCLRGVDDLLLGLCLSSSLSVFNRRLSLGDFNEGALLHNVRCRYFNDSIYTGIGSALRSSFLTAAKANPDLSTFDVT